jgi:hypothetical protein
VEAAGLSGAAWRVQRALDACYDGGSEIAEIAIPALEAALIDINAAQKAAERDAGDLERLGPLVAEFEERLLRRGGAQDGAEGDAA